MDIRKFNEKYKLKVTDVVGNFLVRRNLGIKND